MSTPPTSDGSAPRSARVPPEFNRFYNDHRLNLLRWLVGSGNDAGGQQDEICNDAFLVLYRKWNEVTPEARKVYLYEVATNRAKDYRIKAHKREEATDFEGKHNLTPLHQKKEDPCRRAEDKILSRRALSRLSNRQAQVVLLCTAYGFTMAETAKILGIGMQSVKSTLRSARTKFPDLSKEAQG